PLLLVVGSISHGVARLLGVGPGVVPQVTEGELRTALATAEEEGVIESDERAMLEGAMELRDKLVREIMTPRIDIVGVPADASLPDTLNVAMHEGHSRLPVYEGTLDKIIGIVAAKDLLPYLRQDGAQAQRQARDVARPPFFVPEYKRIAPTLEELRHQRSLMAIVVDADGGTAGLVTLEDLLEEIVGEIQDEYDAEEPRMRIVEDAGGANGETAAAHAVLCEASVTVREFERFWRKSFGETASLRTADGAVADASLSLAALALQLFESVPKPGDRVRAGHVTSRAAPAAPEATLNAWLELEIASMDGPRIEEVKLEKLVEE
ncbi:MAG: CBS domain-containing protein, partial [Armatimonadota bacterium]|nr:CBS domain-containing protein [Armatimonadota bacterium]